MLHAERRGTGPDVVLVHGFTQTGASWSPIVDRLGSRLRSTVVDAPGHGGSRAVHADLWEGADQLVRTGGRAAYVGYSMGGRLCLHAALSHPELVERLVLIGATAGIEDPGERAARRAHDEALAQRLEVEGLPAFVDWWLTQPLFATLPAAASGREERLANSVDGLASSLRLAGTGSQDPLWDRLGSIEMPVLVIAGALDRRYAAVGERLVATIGTNAELALVPGAGHACHLEQPDALCALIERFVH